MKYLIGIDIGTQGTKTVLYNTDGEAVGADFEPSVLLYPAPGAVEQEPEDIYGSVVRTVRNVMEKTGVEPTDVAAIGLDGQMAGFLGIDRDFGAVTPLDSWLDTRCEPYIRLLKETCEEEIIRLTGCPITYAHGPKLLRWMKEFPGIYKRIDKFVEPMTYVTGRLCGLKSDKAYIDYTDLHFSGFADNEHLKWSEELCRQFDVDMSKLPDIISPLEIVGGLTKEAAELCGLLPGTPVSAGCGDQAATSLGSGIVRAGQCFDGAGTASVFSCCTTAYAPDVKHKTVLYPHHVIPGLYQPMAYISGGGLCLKWFRENVLEKTRSYKELEAEAEKLAPGNGGLYFVPHFNGRTCPNDTYVRGMFYGLNFTHGQAAMFKATMEAVAFEYKYYYDILDACGAVPENVTVYGTGGGSVSACFDQIKADVLGAPYAVTERADTAPFGAALVAGCGVGIWKDPAAAAEGFTKLKGIFRPDAGKHEAYGPYAAKYPLLLELCGKMGAALK